MNGNYNETDDASVITSTNNQSQYTNYTEDEPLSTAVVMTLADVIGDDPAEIGVPLYDVIDPDALDSLFSDKHDGSPRMGGKVVFTILDYEVTVHSYGEINVREQH